MTSLTSIADALTDAEVFTDGDWVESKDQDPNGDVRLTQLADVGDGSWLDKSARFMTSETAERLRCTYLKPGDVMVARMPDPLGRCCLFPGHRMPCVTVVDVCIVRPNAQRIDNRYLMHVINSPVGRRGISRHVTGTTRKRISRRNLGRVEIPLPPLPEQKRIAGILDAADALRAKRRESLAQLDTLLQSTFLELFGDPVTNPMGWEERAFGDIATDTKLGLVRSSTDYGRDFPIPYVRMDAITAHGGFLPEMVQNTNATKAEIETHALRPGDFLFNTRNSRPLVGKVCVFPGPEGWLFNNNIMRVQFQDGIEPTVVGTQFQFDRVRRELEKRKSGTTSVFAVYWKALRTLPVLVPPAQLQHRFAAIVHAAEQQQTRLQAHLTQLDTLFASLQSRAFRGEL
jgi:type I restriction enzyme, S subunit